MCNWKRAHHRCGCLRFGDERLHSTCKRVDQGKRCRGPVYLDGVIVERGECERHAEARRAARAEDDKDKAMMAQPEADAEAEAAEAQEEEVAGWELVVPFGAQETQEAREGQEGQGGALLEGEGKGKQVER